MSRKKMYRCGWMSLYVLIFTLMISCVCSIKSNAIIKQSEESEDQVSQTVDVSDVSKSDKVDIVSNHEIKGSEIDSKTISKKATDDTKMTADTVQLEQSCNYTVEFTHKNLQYTMRGGTTVTLSDILQSVGLTGTVTAVQCSDTSLFSASQTSGIWTITSHRAFSTTEWLRVTVDDQVYEIIVTDDLDDEWRYDDNDDGVTVTIMGYIGEAEKVNIPDTLNGKSVTAIDVSVFRECHDMKSITIPSSVTSISSEVFSDCDYLENIEVDSNNKKYLVKEGALYEKNEDGDATKLICCPMSFPKESLTLPPTVDDISDLQFCEILKRIYAFKNFDDINMDLDTPMLILICKELGTVSLERKKQVEIIDVKAISSGSDEKYEIYCNDIAEEYAISAINQELSDKINLVHDTSVGTQDTDGVHSYCGSKEYEVKFVNDNGIELQSSAVLYGKTPSYTGATPTKKADAKYIYTFAGWTPEITGVTGDATYTATYASTVNKYTVTFENEDGTQLQSSKVEYGETPSYTGATPTKKADDKYTYKFAGWKDSNGETYKDKLPDVTGNVTYKATYNEEAMRISYENPQSNIIVSSEKDSTLLQIYVSGTSVPLQITIDTCIDKEIPSHPVIKQIHVSDSELDSNANTYDITMDSHDMYDEGGILCGNISMTDLKGSVEETTTLWFECDDKYSNRAVFHPNSTTSQMDYSDKTREVNGKTYCGITVGSLSPFVLIQYNKKYNIMFVDEDGEVLQSEKVYSNDMPVYTGSIPTKEPDADFHYKFVGWDHEIKSVTGDATYKAVYKSEPHTVKIDPAVAATCTETGLTEGKHCSVCGAVLLKQEKIPVLGHRWDKGKVISEPACGYDGITTYTYKYDPSHMYTGLYKTSDALTVACVLALGMLVMLSLIGLYFSLKRKRI